MDSMSEGQQLVAARPGSTQNIKHASMTTTSQVIVMLSCMTMVFLTGGVAYGLAVMLPEFVRIYKAPRAQAAMVQSLFFAISTGFAGLFWTVPISMIGEGPAVIVGGIMSTIGFIVSCFATSISTVIVFTGIVSGVGLGCCYFVPYFIIPEIFDENGSRNVSLMTIGISLGQVVLSFIFEDAITEYGMSGALLILGGLVLNTVPCGLLIHFRTKHLLKSGVRSEAPTIRRQTCFDLKRRLVLVVQDKCVCLFILACFVYQQSTNFESYFIVDLLEARGFERRQGSFVVSMLGVANFISRVLAAFLRMKLRLKTIYHWTYLTVFLALSHVLVLVLRDYWSIFAACMLFSVCVGMLIAQSPVVFLDIVDKDRYRDGWAVVSVIYGISDIINGFISGVIHDVTGTYDVALLTAAGFGLVTTIITILIIISSNKKDRLKKARYVLIE